MCVNDDFLDNFLNVCVLVFSWDDAWPKQAPRTKNWNVTAEQRKLHHPTVANRGMITDDAATCIDQNFQDRWRCLISVDDIIGMYVQLLMLMLCQ